MKILLISGHGAGDSGAVGNGYKEADLTRELVNFIAEPLRSYAEVDIYDQSRNAFKDVENGTFNVSGYDYVLEVHFNSFKDPSAHGSEIYVTSREAAISVEQQIMKNMKRYFVLRDNDGIFDGVKRTNFLVINTLKNKGISAVLLETCFISNSKDMIVYQSNKKAIGMDIALGIAVGFGLTKNSAETPKPSAPQIPAKKSVNEVANEIINKPNYGGWGTGATRRNNLVTYNGVEFADAVQKRINELVSGVSSTPAKKSVNEVANEIINKPNYGGWGTGATRIQKLTAYNGREFANAVQKRINEILG